MMPASPGMPLEVIEATFVLEFFLGVLDPPAIYRTYVALMTRQTAKRLDIAPRLPCRQVTLRKAERRLHAQSETLLVFSVRSASFCGRVGVLPIGPFAGTDPRSVLAAMPRSVLAMPRHHGNPSAFSSRRNSVTVP